MAERKKFLKKIPRARIYLRLPELIRVFIKISLGRPGKGEKTREWEKAYANYCGAKTAVSFPKARIALFYLLKNLNLPKGSEVILTPITIADIVNSVRWAGLKPVFCDLGKNTYNIDFGELEKSITPKTKAVLITHLAGLATDMDKAAKIAKDRNLILIEDISQSLGGTFNGKKLGTFGPASIASTSFLKTCCTLSGGMLALNENSALAEKIRKEAELLPLPPKTPLLKETASNIILSIATNKLIFPAFTYYAIKLFNSFGSNALEEFIKRNPKPVLSSGPSKKMLCSFTDIQAGMGLKILKGLDESDNKRIKNVNHFIENLSAEARRHLPEIPKNARNVFWRLPFGAKNPEELKKHLFKHYIDSTRTNLVLCSHEPAFKEFAKNTPEAKKAHSPIFIPIHSSFTKKDMIYMAEVINDYFDSKL